MPNEDEDNTHGSLIVDDDPPNLLKTVRPIELGVSIKTKYLHFMCYKITDTVSAEEFPIICMRYPLQDT